VITRRQKEISKRNCKLVSSGLEQSTRRHRRVDFFDREKRNHHKGDEHMADKMKAVGLYEYLPIDDPKSLQNVKVKKPKAKGKDILVEVKAVSVNPVDTKIRAPKKGKEEEAKILGWDAAGVVKDTGDDVEMFQPGDEVYYAGAVNRQGSNSEFHLVDERIAAKKPENLDFSDAAAMPLTTITAWEALFHRMDISRNPEDNEGKKILMVGAAGGVGSIAVQLAKHAGLTVIGTVSREETAEWAKKNGADYFINHYKDFPDQLQEHGIQEVDYIFCMNSTETHWENMSEVIAPQGKICSIVESKEELNMNLIKNKSAAFLWEFMFTRPIYQTEDMIEQHRLLKETARLIEEGDIQTTATKKMQGLTAETFREAHQIVEEGKMIGKLVIKIE
jgi:NADPH:quinone reductase